MKFNKDGCIVLHLGRKSSCSDRNGDRMAREWSPEKALGDLAEKQAEHEPVACPAIEVSSILGCKSTTTRRLRKGITPLYLALVKPHLHPVTSFVSLNTRYVLTNGSKFRDRRQRWLEAQHLCPVKPGKQLCGDLAAAPPNTYVVIDEMEPSGAWAGG